MALTTGLGGSIVERVRKMFSDRGYGEIKSVGSSGTYVIGRKQTSTDHPRVHGDALAYIDANPSFSSADIYRNMKAFYSVASQEKLDPSSSIVYIYNFSESRQHINAIFDAYRTVRGKGEYFLEVLQLTLFEVDRTKLRSVKDFKILSQSNFGWVTGNSGKEYIVDKPPALSSEDSLALYFGCRKGDYVKYKRLARESVGPIWLTTMALITDPLVANLSVGTDGEDEAEEGPKQKDTPSIDTFIGDSEQ
jgi:hypothetical protein